MLNSPEVNWPDLPATEKDDPKIELKKELYQAKLDELKAVQDAIRESISNAQADDYTRGQALYSAYLDVAKGQIDRSQARATFVQVAASAIGTIYTGVVGLKFGLGSGNNALPAQGILPAFFLGASIVLATVYLSFFTKTASVRSAKPSGLLSLRLIEERDDFIRWTSEVVNNRIQWLHASVIGLGFGVFFLPIPFLSISAYFIWIAVLLGVIITALPLYLPLIPRRIFSVANGRTN